MFGNSSELFGSSSQTFRNSSGDFMNRSGILTETSNKEAEATPNVWNLISSRKCRVRMPSLGFQDYLNKVSVPLRV